MKPGLAGLFALTLATPAFAAQVWDPLAPLAQPNPQQPANQQPPAIQPQTPQVVPVGPAVPPPVAIVVPRDWRGVFDAIDAGNWASASAGIATLPRSVLSPLARAELYTAKGSPTVALPDLLQLLAEAPELPQAGQLAAMAVKRGAPVLPAYIVPQRTIALGSAPVRYRAKEVTGDPAADQLRDILTPYIKANDAGGAEAQLLLYAPQITPEGRAEHGQRVAWAYYILGLDLDARRVADTWRQGATGEWAAQSAWISALASWRLGDCQSASPAFQQVARLSDQRELRAGAYYWAARAEQMCHRPRNVEALLRAAANTPESLESFYGLIAREALGMTTRLPPDQNVGFDPPVDQYPNVQRAVELVRIGEPGLAEELIKHQAKIGLPTEHHSLIQLAKRLDLPSAQWSLATNGQIGARADASDRYPNPKWTPIGGWRVDPALAYGHIIQESTFKRTVVSHAGAVGLMQVVPGTASDMARRTNMIYSRDQLDTPAYNLEYGQRFIEAMRSSARTGGSLPKVIASYNAGALPLDRWNQINDKGDPLLWIESLSYWETRYYIPSVMRNMWVYQGLNRTATPTLRAMVQHQWPAFPTAMTALNH